jgi:L-alanine-DL-glutamate epimerase-like enolase superfamily enzyme
LRSTVAIERFPIAGRFTISRGSRTEAVVVSVTVSGEGVEGRGECVPYARYGETPEGVAAALEAQAPALAAGGGQAGLVAGVAAAAGRNALDCALWDWRAKASRLPAWCLAGVPEPQPVTTCYTISLGDPETMEAAAANAATRPLLKIKLGGKGDEARIAAVRRGAPQSRLVVDANESWTPEDLPGFVAACADAGVELIEQPLPAASDAWLAGYRSPVTLCADESVHGLETLDQVAARYQAINIKLDKTGGLTPALELAHAARARGLKIMVGCMLGTSLAMAPAVLLSGFADYVDLDGPLLLARDREPGLTFVGSELHPPTGQLWG